MKTLKDVTATLASLARPYFVACLVITGCGASTDKGGDHVPKGEVYAVAQLPSSSRSLGVTTKVVDSRFFQPQVLIAERYVICMNSEQFSDADVRLVSNAVSVQSLDINRSGLETVLNHALKTIAKHTEGHSKFSSRLEITALLEDGGNCHGVVTEAKADEFPFTELPFKNRNWAVLTPGQLVDPAENVNTIPVIYLRQNLTQVEAKTAAVRSFAVFLGLGESTEKASILNPNETLSFDDLSFKLENSSGQTLSTDDVAIVYGFAALYEDILKPADLGAAQHFADRVSPGSAASDPDLHLETSHELLDFTDIYNSRYLRGHRRLPAEVRVCMQNVSGLVIEASWLAAYLDFGDSSQEPRTNSSLFYQLARRDRRFESRAVLANDRCHVTVIYKNAAQYPFSSETVAGLYGHEGSLKDANGKPTEGPAIYINASHATLDPGLPTTSSRPWAGDTLQHEFAHFMGFQHSNSSLSLLSATGGSRSWDVSGDDARMFDDYLRRMR